MKGKEKNVKRDEGRRKRDGERRKRLKGDKEMIEIVRKWRKDRVG